MTKKDIAKVLSAINKCRKATGLEPLQEIPKGVRRAPTMCPIAKGLNHAGMLRVLGSSLEFTNRQLAEQMGEAIGAKVHDQKHRSYGPRSPKWRYRLTAISTGFHSFVAAFDGGQLPEYQR